MRLVLLFTPQVMEWPWVTQDRDSVLASGARVKETYEDCVPPWYLGVWSSGEAPLNATKLTTDPRTTWHETKNISGSLCINTSVPLFRSPWCCEFMMIVADQDAVCTSHRWNTIIAVYHDPHNWNDIGKSGRQCRSSEVARASERYY